MKGLASRDIVLTAPQTFYRLAWNYLSFPAKIQKKYPYSYTFIIKEIRIGKQSEVPDFHTSFYGGTLFKLVHLTRCVYIESTLMSRGQTTNRLIIYLA